MLPGASVAYGCIARAAAEARAAAAFVRPWLSGCSRALTRQPSGLNFACAALRCCHGLLLDSVASALSLRALAHTCHHIEPGWRRGVRAAILLQTSCSVASACHVRNAGARC